MIPIFTPNINFGLAVDAYPNGFFKRDFFAPISVSSDGLVRILITTKDTLGAPQEIKAIRHDMDNILVGIGAALDTASRMLGFNGNSYDRVRVISAAVQANYTNHRGINVVAHAGNWSVTHDPATNVRASVTRPAGGIGIRHVCTSITATLSASSMGTSNLVKIYLRDGLSDSGTILWSASLIAPAGNNARIILNGLSIVGSPNTAMTLEFNAAAGSGTQENVAMTGYSVG